MDLRGDTIASLRNTAIGLYRDRPDLQQMFRHSINVESLITYILRRAG
jgi:hypothetical protein